MACYHVGPCGTQCEGYVPPPYAFATPIPEDPRAIAVIGSMQQEIDRLRQTLEKEVLEHDASLDEICKLKDKIDGMELQNGVMRKALKDIAKREGAGLDGSSENATGRKARLALEGKYETPCPTCGYSYWMGSCCTHCGFVENRKDLEDRTICYKPLGNSETCMLPSGHEPPCSLFTLKRVEAYEPPEPYIVAADYLKNSTVPSAGDWQSGYMAAIAVLEARASAIKDLKR